VRRLPVIPAQHSLADVQLTLALPGLDLMAVGRKRRRQAPSPWTPERRVKAA
jgi:hypothetical protein